MTATRGLLIDWGDGAGWTDETAYLMSYSVSRGSGAEITAQASPGAATILLKNTTGRFSPDNSGGALYGYLEDGPKVWLGIKSDGTFAAGGTVYGVFAGRITDLSPIPAGGAATAPTCEIVCEDPLGWYGRQEVNIADSLSRTQGSLRAAVLAAIPETRTNLAIEGTPLPISSASGDALSVLSAINAASGTRHYIKPANNPTDWYAYTTIARTSKLTGVADASISSASQHVTSIAGWRKTGATVINEQRATVEPIFVPIGPSTVWTYTETLPIKVTSAAPVTLWADFADFVSVPSLVEVHTGSVTATFTPFGETAKIELTSASSGSVTALSVEGLQVQRLPTISVVAIDSASQAKPRGRRSGPEIGGDFVGTIASAYGITSHMVYRYADPKVRPTVTVKNWLPDQYQRDLYDVLGFTSPQLSVSGKLLEIVGLQHDSDFASASGVLHTTTYQLSESREQSPKAWFTWDVDKWTTGPGHLGY